MAGDSTRIAVIVPNFNHGHFLESHLKAVFAQKPDQVIVIDDASTDRSLEVLRPLEREGKIQLIENKRNLGVNAGGNLAFAASDCDFVHFHAADDLTLPGFLDAVRPLANTYPDAGAIVTHPALMNEDGSEIELNESWSRPSRQTRYFGPEDARQHLDPDRFWLATHASLLNRRKFLEIGGFLPELRWHADWFAIHVLVARFGFAYHPSAFVALRVAATTYSGEGMRDPKAQSNLVRQMWARLDKPEYRDVAETLRSTRAFYGIRGQEKTVRDLSYPWREKHQLLRASHERWVDVEHFSKRVRGKVGGICRRLGILRT